MTLYQKNISSDEMDKIAEFLGVEANLIGSKNPEFSCSIDKCQCGHEIGFYDFVRTAFINGAHDKKYMADFFSGDKSMGMQLSTSIACSSCGKESPSLVSYRYSGPHVCS